MTPGPADFGRVPIDSKAVDTINLRTFGWADRFVFGSSEGCAHAAREAGSRAPTVTWSGHDRCGR